MIANSILILLGYSILVAATVWMIIASIGIFRLSLGFSGRIGGEFWFFLVITVALMVGCWYFFPFEVAMKLAPVSVK